MKKINKLKKSSYFLFKNDGVALMNDCFIYQHCINFVLWIGLSPNKSDKMGFLKIRMICFATHL